MRSLVALLLALAAPFYFTSAQVQFPGSQDEDDDIAERDGLGRRCVPLPECEALMFLVRNRDGIPGMSRRDVFKTVHNVMCGFEGNTPKVLCSEEEEDDEEEEEFQEEFAEEIAPRAGGGVIDLLTGSECEGVLKLHHLRSGGGDVKTTVLRRKQYRNLRRLSQRLVYSTQVDGGCCWKISSSRGFGGSSQRLTLGANGPPDVQPRAAKKTACR